MCAGGQVQSACGESVVFEGVVSANAVDGRWAIHAALASMDGQLSGDVQSSETVADTGGGTSSSAKLWPTIVARATPIIAYARGYTMQHKPVVFGGVAGVVVLLLFIRSKTKKPRQVI